MSRVGHCDLYPRGFDCPLPFLGEGLSFSLEYYSTATLVLTLASVGVSWMTRDWRLKLITGSFLSLWVSTHLSDQWSRETFGWPLTYQAHLISQLFVCTFALTPRRREQRFGLPAPNWIYSIMALLLLSAIMLVANLDATPLTEWRWRNGFYVCAVLVLIAIGWRHYRSPIYREYASTLTA